MPAAAADARRTVASERLSSAARSSSARCCSSTSLRDSRSQALAIVKQRLYAAPSVELGITDLQSDALPLG